MIRTFCIVLLTFIFYSCEISSHRSEDTITYDPTQYERVSINYEIIGSRDTCLVFIHGWNLNMRYWDQQVDLLKERYRILNLDLAGHGNSGRDRDNWTAESFARDIANILEKESIDKVILIGHSMGGDVALQVREIVPQKVLSIIGVDTFKDIDFEVNDAFMRDFNKYLNKFKSNYVEMSDEFARENIRTRDKEVINRIVKDYKDADAKIALEIFKNLIPKHEQEKELLGKLPFSLKIIASDYTPVNEAALKKYAHSGYEVTWIKDSGHFPMVEQPQQFNDALLKVLDTISRY